MRASLVACALCAAPLAAQSSTGALAGVVWDSTARAPLAGAAVLLAHAREPGAPTTTVVTDSLGRWAAGGLAPGAWKLTFLHRRVEEYGVVPAPRDAAVEPGDTTKVELGLPGASTLHAALCSPSGRGAERGLIVGSVRDEDAGTWVAGARVVVGWRVLELAPTLRLRTVRVPVATGEDGTFRLCGVPADDGMLVSAAALADGDSLVSGELPVEAGERGVTRVEIGVGRLAMVRDSSARGPATRLVGRARLEGVVLEPSGAPRAGAHVILTGTGREAVTSGRGTFRLDSLPSGSWTVDAFALGLAPTRRSVRLTPGEATHTTLQFESTVAALERVRIYGRPSAAQALMDDFFARRKRGFGKFITPDDLKVWRPSMVSSLFYRVPGAQVLPRANGMARIRGRGGCEPEVYIDGMSVQGGADDLDAIVPAADVLAVEAHHDPGGLPGNIFSRRMCLVVVIWTKRDLNNYPTPK